MIYIIGGILILIGGVIATSLIRMSQMYDVAHKILRFLHAAGPRSSVDIMKGISTPMHKVVPALEYLKQQNYVKQTEQYYYYWTGRIS